MKIYICLLVVLVVDEIQCVNDRQNLISRMKPLTSVAPESMNDAAVGRLLAAIANRKFPNDDTNLLELMKKRVIEASMTIKDNPKASFKAAHKKAQDFVSNITASYTQAIFKSKSPAEAKQTLHRFQKIIKKIVDFTKSGIFLP